MQPIRRRSVVDVALQGDVVEAYGVAARAKALNRLRVIDIVFRVLTRAAARGVLVLLGGVFLALVDGALPALRTFGLNFVVAECGNPVTGKFGRRWPTDCSLGSTSSARLMACP